MARSFLSLILLAFSVSGHSLAAPPAAPTDSAHPGSLLYDHTFKVEKITCAGREISVYLPNGVNSGEQFAAVSFGHGQALGVDVYDATFRHLAGKGIAAIFMSYDDGFFDQNWLRMGSDFATLTDCAVTHFPQIDPQRVVYSGHSKGAYVASIAAGSANEKRLASAPKAIVLFNAAGLDATSLRSVSAETAMTVVFSDADKTVERKISDDIFTGSPSQKKQLITLGSYSQTSPKLVADHFWPMTKSSFFGGQPVCSFHYYGSWKWLAAAARDLSSATLFTDPYLYGFEAGDKGMPGLRDDIARNWK